MAEVIDAFGHVMPREIHRLLHEANPNEYTEAHDSTPRFWDIEQRIDDLNECNVDKQVLTLASPPSWLGMEPEDALPIVRDANDTLRAIADRHPDRFIPTGTLPFLHGEYVDEMERCIDELGMAGIQIFSNINGAPLTAERNREFFQTVSDRDITLWMHPQIADYGVTRDSTFYAKVFGWLMDTSVALSRLVFSGFMEDYDIDLIAHHLCAMVPHFSKRIETFYQAREFYPHTEWADLERPPLHYFRQFYGDTVVNGSVSALECGRHFLGTGHVVFGSDYPYGPDKGRRWLRDTDSIRRLDATEAEIREILGGNLRDLLAT